MQPEDLKTVCKKYRQKKAGDPVDGDPINYEHDETGDEINEDELTSTNGSNENLNKIVSQVSVEKPVKLIWHIETNLEYLNKIVINSL